MLVVVAVGHGGCGGVGSRWSLNADQIWICGRRWVVVGGGLSWLVEFVVGWQ
uniref:Uncharacterized protein n=1 Tax=Fagus sylvatica TaxID=28930 RepID=A0A2N9ISR5_FAGSY